MFSSSVRCLYLMEIGLPGKAGLTCSKHVATGRGFEYDCVIIPLLPTKENIAKEKEKNQKIAWSAIAQLNLIFLGGTEDMSGYL